MVFSLSFEEVMKVGDLIKWQNGNKEYELGVVTEMCQGEAIVWFFADKAFSIITIGGLEMINEAG